MASVSSSSSSVSELTKQLRSHEVAIAELNSLPSSRPVYQRNGNLFFRTTIQKATTMEQSVGAIKAKARTMRKGRANPRAEPRENEDRRTLKQRRGQTRRNP